MVVGHCCSSHEKKERARAPGCRCLEPVRDCATKEMTCRWSRQGCVISSVAGAAGAGDGGHSAGRGDLDRLRPAVLAAAAQGGAFRRRPTKETMQPCLLCLHAISLTRELQRLHRPMRLVHAPHLSATNSLTYWSSVISLHSSALARALPLSMRAARQLNQGLHYLPS